jgi:DNA-directed RNA polymerase subunit E'
MYKIVRLKDTVRVPPNLFGQDRKEVVAKLLREDYEGILDKDLGLIICVTGVVSVGRGIITPGDGATYHDTEFEILTYRPELQEITMGQVVEIVDFGAFVRLGPLDGLVHVSQITDDFIIHDKKNGRFLGKESNRVLREGDLVRARIVAVSIKGGPTISGKIALTMRQPGLGKLEWIDEDKREVQ